MQLTSGCPRHSRGGGEEKEEEKEEEEEEEEEEEDSSLCTTWLGFWEPSLRCWIFLNLPIFLGPERGGAVEAGRNDKCVWFGSESTMRV